MMNTKIPANQIQRHIKRIICHDQAASTLGTEDGSTYKNKQAIHHIIKMKYKNHKVISIDLEIFNKIQYSFMIKNFKKWG